MNVVIEIVVMMIDMLLLFVFIDVVVDKVK